MSDSPDPGASWTRPPDSAITSQSPSAVVVPSVTPTAADLPLLSSAPTPSSPLVRFGGLLGIVGSAVGLIVLVAACAGMERVLPASMTPGRLDRYNHVMALSAVCVALGVFGLLVALLGAFTQRRRIAEDTHVMQAAFACLMSVIGGLLEMAVWLRWPIFYK